MSCRLLELHVRCAKIRRWCSWWLLSCFRIIVIIDSRAIHKLASTRIVVAEVERHQSLEFAFLTLHRRVSLVHVALGKLYFWQGLIDTLIFVLQRLIDSPINGLKPLVTLSVLRSTVILRNWESFCQLGNVLRTRSFLKTLISLLNSRSLPDFLHVKIGHDLRTDPTIIEILGWHFRLSGCGLGYVVESCLGLGHLIVQHLKAVTQILSSSFGSHVDRLPRTKLLGWRVLVSHHNWRVLVIPRFLHCLLALELSVRHLARKSAIAYFLVAILMGFDKVIWFNRGICTPTLIDGSL